MTDGAIANRERSMPALVTLALILMPMLLIVLGMRLYSHLVHVRHVYPFGFLVHHLYWGVLCVIPAAFVLAFVRHRCGVSIVALIVLGAGSGMILDEIVYLVATKASDEDYLSAVSLGGSLVFISLALMLLLTLYRLASNRDVP